LGAGMILASTTILEFKGRPSTTRMRIVQSLVLSDLMLGYVSFAPWCMICRHRAKTRSRSLKLEHR
jgi:hypothetical protein